MEDSRTQGRVIVTYSRSLIALMIAQSLGARNIDVIGCDDVSMTVLSFSKYVSKNCLYAPPDADEKRFIDDLVRIAKENKPSDDRPYLLIPAFREAKIIARHKKRFDGLITVACPDIEAIDQVDHKDRFAKTAQKLDVESPKTWLPDNEKDLEQALDEIEFPVFIKPPNEVGGRGIAKIENDDDLKAAFKKLQAQYPEEQILIQGLAEGVDYCFCGLFDHGDLVAGMVYHNLHKFPKEAGPGVIRETVESKKFEEIAQKLMKPLAWHGVAGIDFMWDEDETSTPLMIEVNPRFWSGLDHSVKSDVDFPWMLYQLFAEGRVASSDEANVGHKTSLPGFSTLAQIEELLSEAFNFNDLETAWPEIKEHLADKDFGKAAELFKDALDESITLEEAYKSFKNMMRTAEQAESMTYADDDPFVGLGVLFILGSLIKHGTLPPEIKR